MPITGAGIVGGLTSKHEIPTTGNDILLTGLAVQTAAFALFLALLSFVNFQVFQNKSLVSK
jgi:hypothetical protein